jgi:type III restriction enzyme
MELKEYQEKAVNELVKKYNQQKDGSIDNFIIFRSPTGSGKTIMMAEFLKRIISNNNDINTVFIWVAPRDLHNQSKIKIETYLKKFPYKIIDKDSITANPFEPNDLFFFNWEKGITKKDEIWNNILVRENETENNLQDIMNKTRENKRNVVLIIDESHQNVYAPRTQEFIKEIIQPNIIIMVSATPKEISQSCNSVSKVIVKFSDIVDSGLIKKDTIINADLENVHSDTTTDAILEASLKKQIELKELNPKINPLILVQLPNDSQNMSELDKNKRDSIEEYLFSQNINYENKKLAVWLSDEKKNLDDILEFNSNVQVLIFKQAIALGWDCPRAQILAMFRENKNEVFQIQTVGRILRMPEAKHYENDKLNSAYIYTALDQISITGENDGEKGYFNFHSMKISDIAKNNPAILSSVYFNRTEQHTLTKEHFSPIFKKNLLTAFEINEIDILNSSEKISNKLKTTERELSQDIIINEIIKNLETYDGTKSSVEKITINSAHEEIEYAFEQIIRSWCLPYGIEKSKAKIKNCLYEIFAKGGFGESLVKKIIVCSNENYKFIENIVEISKREYEPIRKKADDDKKDRTLYNWELPKSDIVNENYEKAQFIKYALQPCYLKYDSNIERDFAKKLDLQEDVIWWYKNGVGYGKYFAIEYFDTEKQEQRLFYPDWIYKTKDGKIWIEDTKSGFTATSQETKDKEKALEEWIAEQNKKGDLVFGGGIVKLDH